MAAEEWSVLCRCMEVPPRAVEVDDEASNVQESVRRDPVTHRSNSAGFD